MTGKSNRLTSSLRLAFLLLLLTTVSLVWFYVETIRRYDLKLRHVSSQQLVVHDLEELARLSFLELQLLGDRVESGRISDALGSGEARRRVLQEKIARLREHVAQARDPGQVFAGTGSYGSLPEALDKVEEIVAYSALLDEALEQRRISTAQLEWRRLVGSGLVNELAMMVEAAIGEQERQLRTSITAPVTATPAELELFPVVILVVSIVSVVLAWIGSWRLSRSANSLHEGARAFIEGDFAHRIPELKVAELSGLAKALNAMAERFTDHRKRLQDTASKLESIIEERTRELTVSNQKLAEVDVARQQLLSNISHEFRTPLTAIRGQADIALRGSGRPEHEYREAIERILRQAQHATDIVDDLLFIARADAGEPRLEWHSVSIGKVIESVCQDFDTAARQRKATIEQHLKVKNAVVRGDSRRLRQVFAILLDNALRYSNIGGTVEVYVWLAEHEVRIEFRDHGIGLDEEEAGKAFERFYRSRRAQEHSRGTGLGLSVAKVIVEAHSGSISLSGAPGVGAQARVVLPLHTQFKGMS